MKIKPLADRVLVLPAPAEEKVGGIIIPDTAQEKKDDPMVLKENDTVLYGKYSGTELQIDGEKYLMMRQSDVLGVVED